MATLQDRIVSALTYFTFGIFGIIWIVYVNVAKVHLSDYVKFNIFQSFFITVIFAAINIVFGMIVKFGAILPPLGKILDKIGLFLVGNPIYFGFSLVGLIINIFVIYLVVLSLLGKKPFVPYVSVAINSIVRG